MNQIPDKTTLIDLLLKILPPFILSVMAKIASDYKKGKRIGFISSAVVVLLAACGAILGYWTSMWLQWTEYKMTMTIFFFGLFADKFFEYIFSKTFINSMFNLAEDWVKQNLKLILSKLKQD